VTLWQDARFARDDMNVQREKAEEARRNEADQPQRDARGSGRAARPCWVTTPMARLSINGPASSRSVGHDGKPCLVLQYPPETPLFGNTYDEIRQVGPRLYLARLYERCPCVRFRGCFAIQVCGSCP